MGRRQIRLRLIKPLAEPREPYLRNDGFDLEPTKKPKLDLSDVKDYDDLQKLGLKEFGLPAHHCLGLYVFSPMEEESEPASHMCTKDAFTRELRDWREDDGARDVMLV